MGSGSLVPSTAFRMSLTTLWMNVVRALSFFRLFVRKYSAEESIRICLKDGSTQGLPMLKTHKIDTGKGLKKATYTNLVYINNGMDCSQDRRTRPFRIWSIHFSGSNKMGFTRAWKARKRDIEWMEYFDATQTFICNNSRFRSCYIVPRYIHRQESGCRFNDHHNITIMMWSGSWRVIYSQLKWILGMYQWLFWLRSEINLDNSGDVLGHGHVFPDQGSYISTSFYIQYSGNLNAINHSYTIHWLRKPFRSIGYIVGLQHPTLIDLPVIPNVSLDICSYIIP